MDLVASIPSETLYLASRVGAIVGIVYVVVECIRLEIYRAKTRAMGRAEGNGKKPTNHRIKKVEEV